MPLKYSCFISYAHGQGKYVGPLVQAIYSELLSQLEMHCTEQVYLDENRLLPGYEYNEALAKAICQSACMVVAYAPIYAEKDYCRREFAAMQELEKQRKKILGDKAIGHGFIIPVMFAGDISTLPENLRHTTHVCDISTFTLSSHRLGRNLKFSQALEPVCKGILEAANLLKNNPAFIDSVTDCANFSLPTAAPWAPIAAPLPFPGREVTP